MVNFHSFRELIASSVFHLLENFRGKKKKKKKQVSCDIELIKIKVLNQVTLNIAGRLELEDL